MFSFHLVLDFNYKFYLENIEEWTFCVDTAAGSELQPTWLPVLWKCRVSGPLVGSWGPSSLVLLAPNPLL